MVSPAVVEIGISRFDDTKLHAPRDLNSLVVVEAIFWSDDEPRSAIKVNEGRVPREVEGHLINIVRA